MKPPVKAPTLTETFSAGHLSFEIRYSSTWEDKPLSLQKLERDEHYRRWALGKHGVRYVVKFILHAWSEEHRRHNKANPREKVKFTRQQMIDRIATLVGYRAEKLKNLINRSSSVVSKRHRFVSK